MSGHRRLTLSLALSLVLGLLFVGPLACTTASLTQEMDYADQAEYLFQQAERAMERGDYLQATSRYNTVRNQYPYSRWAAMSNLRIGDAYFAQKQYASAVQQYRGFIQLYPRHEKVEYAHWQVATAFYEQMPSEFFILPPNYERDLSTTRDAAREIRIFLRRYENSEFAEEANQKLRKALRVLADHEYYVATYYYDRENPRATANRLTYLLRNFAGLGLDPEALFLLGKAYLQLDEPDRAVIAWTDLVDTHPEHPRAKEVQSALDSL